MPQETSGSNWTAIALRNAIHSGDVSAVEVCTGYLDRIQDADVIWNSMTAVFRDEALSQATAIDRDRRTTKQPLPLLGVPITVKDVLCTRGNATTAASRILSGFTAPYDATVVGRLKQAGAIVIGKTNCDEFAMGSSTEHSAYGPSKNPWDVTRTPGGSSGGAAAAVAARFAPVSIGTDTGGSIRQPAAFCGVVGLKPTYGRVSRYGLLAFASSLDQVGPLTLSVADAALVLTVISGLDSADATSADQPVPDYTSALTGTVEDLKIGVPRKLLNAGDSGLDGEILDAFNHSLEVIREAGATLVDIELPHASHAVPTYYLVAPAEASSNLARYDGIRFGARSTHNEASDASNSPALSLMYNRTRKLGFGPEVKRRIMLGTYALSAGYYDAYYLKAQQVRSLIRRDYDLVLGGNKDGPNVDVVALPTTPTPAFQLGKHSENPLAMYLRDVFTVSANLTGLPAISIPAGFTKKRLPIGLQLVGRAFDEETLLRTGDAYEKRTPWNKQSPQELESKGTPR